MAMKQRDTVTTVKKPSRVQPCKFAPCNQGPVTKCWAGCVTSEIFSSRDRKNLQLSLPWKYFAHQDKQSLAASPEIQVS